MRPHSIDPVIEVYSHNTGSMQYFVYHCFLRVALARVTARKWGWEEVKDFI